MRFVTRSDVSITDQRDSAAVERVLRSLPKWFGIEEAIQQYARDAADANYQSLLALRDGDCIGVALTRRHFAESAELHLIAVSASARRMGVGRTLVERAASDLRLSGAKALSVHTVGPSYADGGYAETRKFYASVGFIPIEEHNDLDWNGPTLILVMPLT